VKNMLKQVLTQKQQKSAGTVLLAHRSQAVLIIYAIMTFALFFPGCAGLSRKMSSRVSVSVKELVPEAARIIREGLADSDPQIRANAIEVVAAAQRTELMPEVQQLLKDDFVPVRFAAALAVGDTGYYPAKSMVQRLLSAPDENSKIAAAYAMSKLGTPEHFELVREAITSMDQTVRANAAVLLGKSGDKDALKLLYWALNDRDSDDKVRFQTAEARARLGDETVFPKLWAIALSSYADDRAIGVRAMGALGTEKAREVLITKLDDEILEVRLTAAEQLGTLGDNTGEPEVLDVFSKDLTAPMDKEGRERVNVLTAMAIGRIGTPRLVKFLPDLLKNESKFVRIAAAKAVFQCSTGK